MKKCKYCNVTVDTDKTFCPLCYNRLDKIDDVGEEFYTPRMYNETSNKRFHFLSRLFLFLSICSTVVCLLINTLVDNTVTWWPIVSLGIIYLWVLVRHTILSRSGPISKVFMQIIILILLLYFSERLSLEHWLIPYVYPSIAMAAALVLLMMVFISPKRNEYVFSFLLMTAILGSVSTIFMFTNSDEFTLLNLISLSFNGTICIGYILFSYNAIKTELTRKWHL